MVRGHLVEVRQRAFQQRLQRFHESLSNRLKQAAPDLLPSLQPPPPKVSGYGILPRLIPDPPPPPAAPPQVTSYSWRWSDTLIARQQMALDRLEHALAHVTEPPESTARPRYQRLIASYQIVVRQRRAIDADIDYNWLWQARIAADRPLYDRLTARLSAAVERQKLGGGPPAESEAPVIGFDPPAFVRVDPPSNHERLISVPFFTDIEDTGFVAAFKQAVEDRWHARLGDTAARVRVTVTVIPTARLYCSAPDGKTLRPACVPPARGATIDLAAHVARFPKEGAVLTTGASSLQTIGTRAIVLGPHDVAPRVLAHEFGHILGLPDAYLRGYRDLGADGFQVMELVPDRSDLMSSPGQGSVLARHFEGLITARDIQTSMQAGLDALYRRGDPAGAAEQFRRVLQRNPDHYGATFQLAKALDRAGQPDAALAVWKRMLPMAEAAHDAETIKATRARLDAPSAKRAP